MFRTAGGAGWHTKPAPDAGAAGKPVLAIPPLRAGLEWLWADGRWAVSRALLAAALFLAAVSPLGPADASVDPEFSVGIQVL